MSTITRVVAAVICGNDELDRRLLAYVVMYGDEVESIHLDRADAMLDALTRNRSDVGAEMPEQGEEVNE